MAKFNLEDLTAGSSSSSSSSSPRVEPQSGKAATSGTIVYQDETMRVMERGKDWKEYVVYNYVDMPKEYDPQNNRNVRYGLTFSNRQAAQKGFARAKENRQSVVEVGETKMNKLNIL